MKKIFIFLLLLVCLSSIAVVGVSSKNKTTIQRVDDDNIKLNIMEKAGVVEIQNSFFNDSVEIDMCYIDESMLAKDLILFYTPDERYLFMGIDILTKTFCYIYKVDDSCFYSQVKLDSISSTLNFNSDQVITNLINKLIASSKENEKYYPRLLGSLKYWVNFFSIEYKKSRISKSNNYSYNVTGENNNAVLFVNFLLDSAIILPENLYTEGVVSKVVLDTLDNLTRLFIMRTEFDELYNEYLTYLKSWNITYSDNQSKKDKIIEFHIKPEMDLFIKGDKHGGIVHLASSGKSYLPIKSISFKATLSNYQYVNRYNLSYATPDMNHKKETKVFNFLDFIMAKSVPFYEEVKNVYNGLISGITDIKDSINDMYFDSIINSFQVKNGDRSIRSIGFNIENGDLNHTFFVDKYLHNYFFYQYIYIAKTPNTISNLFFNIDILPMFDFQKPIKFNINRSTKFIHNCTNKLQHVQQNNECIHSVECNDCGYSFFEKHAYDYTMIDSNVHLAKCLSCGVKYNLEHNLYIVAGGNECNDCDYFEKTLQRYISNNDGFTHTVRSGRLIAKEPCFAMITRNRSTGKCVKCGQIIR